MVGFSGSVVYCLSSQSVRRVDVQLAPAMYYYLDSGRLQEAHQLACLGVTDTDWRHLGNAALTNMQLDVSRKSLIQPTRTCNTTNLAVITPSLCLFTQLVLSRKN